MEKKRILVVDDEAGFTRLLKLALRTYEIREENDPTRALQAALEFRPDLVLLDVIMPEVDGVALASRIRGDTSLAHVPIVFVTASVSPDQAQAERQIRGFPYLPKPVGLDAILECIEEQLAAAA
jgi:two-component system, OmpR family, response regulator